MSYATYKVVALTWGVEEDTGAEEEDCTEDRRRGEPMDSGGVVISATVSSRLLGPCGTRPLPSPLAWLTVAPELEFSSVGLMISTECLL